MATTTAKNGIGPAWLKFFMWICGGLGTLSITVLTLFVIPWANSMSEKLDTFSSSLSEVKSDIKVLAARMDNVTHLQTALENLRKELHDHLHRSDIHLPRLNDLDARIKALENHRP